MLVFDLDPIFALRGITRKYSFLKQQGLSHMVAQRMAAGVVKVMHADHVEKICLALNCAPQDLMKWIPKDGQAVPDHHPLQLLRREQKQIDLLSELRNLPLEQVADLRSFMEEMKEG